MNATEWQMLIGTRDALLRAGRGGKGQVVASAAAALGCSVATLYRKLEEAGLDTGRKRRADAGTSDMTLAELRLVSGLLFTSRRQNEKQLLTVEDALDMALASGAIATSLSPARVGALLRQHHLHPDQLAQPKPATELQSLHPNHVWGMDASTCVLYYLRSGHLEVMDRDAYYKNKPANLARVVNDLCQRYVMADHYSAAMKVRYYLGGETAENAADFLIYCVSRQEGVPFHGVPMLLVLDQGPGNASHLLKNLADRLGVKLLFTGVGNPRAKGFIEKPQDLVERHFEGRLRMFEPGQLTHEGLNAAVELWAATYCSNRRHSRTGEHRYSSWMRIAPEQLRVPASEALLRELVTHEPVQRRVSNTMTVSFACKGWPQLDYDVSRVPGVVVGGKVLVSINAYRAPAIDVQTEDVDTGQVVWQTVAPIERNEAGFRTDAPVIGEEFRAAAYTPVDRERNRLVQEAYRQPGDGLPSLEEAARARKAHAQAYAGVVDAMADVKATVVPAYLPRRGTPLEAGPARLVLPVMLSVVDASRRLKDQMREHYSPQVYAFLADKFAAGVPEHLLPEIAAQFSPAGGEQPAQPAGLRAVGGAS